MTIFRFVGYDVQTDEFVESYDIPAKEVSHAKEVAHVSSLRDDALGDVPLGPEEAQRIAGALGVPIDPAHREYFLEPSADMPLPRKKAP
jgi:hypothetical protein